MFATIRLPTFGRFNQNWLKSREKIPYWREHQKGRRARKWNLFQPSFQKAIFVYTHIHTNTPNPTVRTLGFDPIRSRSNVLMLWMDEGNTRITLLLLERTLAVTELNKGDRKRETTLLFSPLVRSRDVWWNNLLCLIYSTPGTADVHRWDAWLVLTCSAITILLHLQHPARASAVQHSPPFRCWEHSNGSNGNGG